MSYTADYLIAKRKEKWEELHSIEYDKQFRDAVANELLENAELLSEVKANPEKLIELVFIVVDKNQKTMPFFLNDVQHDFINTLNKAIEDFKNGEITDISLLVLKGRQQGFTTLVTAYQLACSILNKNFQGYTLADKSDNSEAIFQNKAKFPYSQLPEALKPTDNSVCISLCRQGLRNALDTDIRICERSFCTDLYCFSFLHPFPFAQSGFSVSQMICGFFNFFFVVFYHCSDKGFGVIIKPKHSAHSAACIQYINFILIDTHTTAHIYFWLFCHFVRGY